MNRRNFFRASAGAGWLFGSAGRVLAAQERVVPEWEKPVFDLHKSFTSPVKIASIELLRAGSSYFVRTRSTDGATGVIETKDIADYIPILLRRVIPAYLGKDARDLETLVDDVYVANYKLAGQPFWCPVAYVEQSLFDLLGKLAGKPAGELMGGVIRKEIPVYLSGSGRDTTAEQEVDVYVKAVEYTGAKAVKFKIGGRMSRNQDTYPGRTETLIELARKRLGDKITLYADGNGSFNAAKGIEIGRLLEKLKYAMFEEPCPWEELSEQKKVADALAIPVAGGEQDASLWRFQWMIDNRVFDVVQLDLNYNGGFVRAARVARMARRAKMAMTPHNTQTGAASVNILLCASTTPNIGPYMEYPWRAPEKPVSWFSPNFEVRNGVIKVPTGPGLGIEIDPDYLKKAQLIKA